MSRPGRDIQIRYTGLRPGEKLREELVLDQEILLPTPHPKINRVSYGVAAPRETLLSDVDGLCRLAAAGDFDALRNRLFGLAPSNDRLACRPAQPALVTGEGAALPIAERVRGDGVSLA